MFVKLRENGFAIPIAQISDDIQNKKRDVIHPNPGAFETKADSLLDDINKDLTVTSVGTLDMGNNTVTASFKNSPILNLDPNHIYTGTIDTVDISYQLNNEAPVMEQWTGNLSIGQTTNYSFNTKLSITKGKIYFIAVTAKLHSAKSKDIYAFNDRLSRQVNIKMAGAYYIGGNNPDFIDGDSAMANLVVCHESAPVTFLFRPGHYHLLNPQGSDSLTVMSETGNNTDVEIDMEGIHASNLKIKKVTLSARNNLGWRPLEVASTDLLIDSCIVQGILKGNTYTDGLAIETCGNLTITNNTFKNLNSGITYKDFYSIASSKHEVSKNTFENIKTVFVIYNVGCTIGPTSYIKFHHNKLSNFNSGIEISGQRSIYLKVYNNDLTQAKQSAISVTTYLGTVPLLFYNNFISGGSLLTASYTSTKGSWSSKYFNTIYISSSNLLTFRNNSIYGSLNLVDNTTISFNNNSIYSDTAVTLLSDSFFGFTGDNNNIYSTGNALVYLSRLVGSPYSPVIKSLDTLKSSNTSANQKSISYNPYYTSSTDLHSNSKFLQNKALPDTMIKVDFDGQLRDLNNPDIGADEIDLTTDEVWPGDANGDSKVDNIDLLSIGLYNGSNGLVRATTGINWISYLSNNWGQTQFNLMDYKHADCNGDGAINDKDTLAILQNFGLYHNTNHQPIDPPLINAGNELYFVFPQKPKPGYVTGDTIFAEIWLGKQNATIQNCYGIAFNVATFAECITPGSMHLSIPNNWLGNGQNAYRLHRTNENWGVAFAAFVKKDHVPVTGYGKIATFYFIYNGKSPWDGIPLKFENITAIDQKGNLLNITPYNENIVTGITTETGKQNELSVSPNPFYGNSTINYKIANEAFIKMEVFNNIGQKIGTLVNQKQHPGNYQLKFDSKEYQMENGIYFIRLMNDEHVKILKIVIAN